MARQFVYFMQGLSKTYPTRKVLDNIHLSFYPDAKIGVLGVNGSGKHNNWAMSTDTGVNLVTDQPVEGVASISVEDGLAQCWG